MKSQALYHSNSMIIIQGFSKAGSAQKRKMHAELEKLHLQQFLSHKAFAVCFTEKKIRQHSHHHTALVCYSKVLVNVSLTLPVSIGTRSLNACVRNAR